METPSGDSERLLLVAVLVRAVEDITLSYRMVSDEQRTALWWVKNWKERHFKIPFSFPWVCEHLDLDPYEMRKNILGSTKLCVPIKKYKNSYSTKLAREIVNQKFDIFEHPTPIFLSRRK